MKVLLLSLLLVLPITLLGSDPSAEAALRNFTKTSSVAQADQFFRQAQGFLITDPAGPFRFKKVGKIRELTRITITLTLRDGDTGPGNIDENQLTLALDGIDTGIKLNGFPETVTQTTQTLSGVPLNEEQIRAALKADGKLNATIIDADPGDNQIAAEPTFTTTLELKGQRRS